MTDDDNLIGPDETAYTLELTPSELKVTYAALHAMLDDFGHEESDVQHIVRAVLDKLPGEHDVRSIDLEAEDARRDADAG